MDVSHRERERENVCVVVLFVVCVFHLITFIILLFNVHAGVVAPHGRRTVVDVAARAHPFRVVCADRGCTTTHVEECSKIPNITFM